MDAKQTPLIDLLERVPADARVVYEHDQFHSQNIPVGRLFHEAAAELRRLSAQADRDTALLRQVQRVMGLMGADLICGAAHHGKADRHDIGDPCPIQKRWHEVFATLRERLEGKE